MAQTSTFPIDRLAGQALRQRACLRLPLGIDLAPLGLDASGALALATKITPDDAPTAALQ